MRKITRLPRAGLAKFLKRRKNERKNSRLKKNFNSSFKKGKGMTRYNERN